MFPWQPPTKISFQARASAKNLPGTWGIGLWNDPFSLSLGISGGVRMLPSLPNAAWFFFASLPNYLAFRDDLPGYGALAATFSSPNLPTIFLAPSIFALPLASWERGASLLRRMASRLIAQDASELRLDPTEWHAYSLEWSQDQTRFSVDNQPVLETQFSPNGPLGLVLWVDNQYAAFPPKGKFRYGTLENKQESWVEIDNLEIIQGE